MTGRERENLSRRVASAIFKLNDLADALEAARVEPGAPQKLRDTALYLSGLHATRLRPGALKCQRWAS